MKMKSFFFLVLACLATSLSADLGLPEAYALALKQSESLASQQELVTQAEERYLQAVGNVLPSLSASAWLGFQDGLSRNSAKLAANQPLFRGLREYAALRQAKGAIRYQELGQRWAALQLYSDMAQSFYLVLSLEKDLATQSGEIDLYAKRIDELKDFVRIGRARETEILSVQSAQAILKAQIEQSKAQVAAARELLAFLTGLDPSTPLSDDPAVLPELGSVEGYLSDIPKRPDIQAALANINLAKESVNIAQGQHWPSADLSGNYYFDNPGSDTQAGRWDAQIGLTLPLFMGGSVSAQTRQAKSQVKQAELNLRQQTRLASQAIRDAHAHLRYDLSQAAALDDAWQIAEKNFKAESRDYKNGLVTNLELLQSLTAYQDTQRALDRARYAAKADFARLQSLAARISPPASAQEANP
jgi:outer membrane protein